MPTIMIKPTIKEALNNIVSNDFVLPAIQRKFVWSPTQIETLFDSIMRGYPINGFMLWHIEDERIRNTQKFYMFLKDYCQKYGEENPDFAAGAKSDFYAVIDGQQRLTSLYIGFFGSYRYKRPSKWWRNDEEVLPTRHLYLNLKMKFDLAVDNQKEFDFRFLSADDLNSFNGNEDYFWFKVNAITSFQNTTQIIAWLASHNLSGNSFALETLIALFEKYSKESLINYTTISDQDQNKVLDIFIRTNSGGTQLTFSDLLMSISSANWENHDARKEIAETKKQIFDYGHPNFNVTQDFILKAILVFESDDIRFKIENFSQSQVRKFEDSWDRIRKSLVATFQLLESLGYSDSLLTAKNAAIPIAYYLYKNNLVDRVSRIDKEEKVAILKWLNLSLLKRIFGGQSDTILRKFRELIKSDNSGRFPFPSIVSACAADPDKNYTLDEAFIDGLLTSQYQSPEGSLLLQLLYPDKVLQHGRAIAQDHMHPKTVFETPSKLASLNLSDELLEFYQDKTYYNSILNLQLLSAQENGAGEKGDMPLEEWFRRVGTLQKSDLYLDEDTSLDIKDFKQFIETRKRHLKQRLLRIFQD